MHTEFLWQRIRELFPNGAALTHIDEASLVVAWPLTDDASRPNRRSQPVAVRVANEVLKALDHANDQRRLAILTNAFRIVQNGMHRYPGNPDAPFAHRIELESEALDE